MIYRVCVNKDLGVIISRRAFYWNGVLNATRENRHLLNLMPTSGRVNNLVIRWDKTVWTTDVWNLIKSPSLFHFLNKFTVGR